MNKATQAKDMAKEKILTEEVKEKLGEKYQQVSNSNIISKVKTGVIDQSEKVNQYINIGT